MKFCSRKKKKIIFKKAQFAFIKTKNRKKPKTKMFVVFLYSLVGIVIGGFVLLQLQYCFFRRNVNSIKSFEYVKIIDKIKLFETSNQRLILNIQFC